MISFNKLRSKSLQELTNLYYQDIDILKYNRSVFFNRDYDNLYEKLIVAMNNSKKMRNEILKNNLI
jgi:hypothetical protein